MLLFLLPVTSLASKSGARRRRSRSTAAVTSAQATRKTLGLHCHGTDPVLISAQSLRTKPCRLTPVLDTPQIPCDRPELSPHRHAIRAY